MLQEQISEVYIDHACVSYCKVKKIILRSFYTPPCIPLVCYFCDLNGFILTLLTYFPLLNSPVPGHVLSPS